ncbi:MAG: Rieske 2Fe-2S domain-containing protein [Phycisphaerales bacterium]
MSVTYGAIGWNRQKRIYDFVLIGTVIAYIAAFVVVGKVVSGTGDAVHDDAMLLIRALGTCGLLMLHVVLWIGPLCRLDARFLPLLYNRRHLGVATFGVGAAHALLTLVQYHGFGNVSPIVSLVESNTRYGSIAGFPFEALGVAALLILFLMAATSHDFWLSVLSARAWKWLHMSVYAAYALLVLHVVLGALQQERSPVLATLLIGGVLATAGLHVIAARRERRKDAGAAMGEGGMIDACGVSEIPDGRAKVVSVPGGERIAVFKYRQTGGAEAGAGGRLVVSAVANVCAHQQGPLGEGKVVDGCITCPWHGYQYRPGDGCAPPPFHEKIATFRVSVRGERVLVDPKALPAGTAVPPVVADGATARTEDAEFYTGYLPAAPRGIARITRRGAAAIVALAVGVASLTSAVQNAPVPSAWPMEPIALEGTLVADPYPMLLSVRVADGGDPARLQGAETALLVATGKFGFLEPGEVCGPAERAEYVLSAALARRVEEIRQSSGRRVRVRGTLLRREGRIAIEVGDEGEALRVMESVEPGAARPAGQSLGPVTLVGEIVDPKCFFGAMKPGEGKTHKACAIRCVAGGITPVLVLRDARGEWTYAVVSAPGGSPANGLVRPFVGEPVRVRGQLRERAGVYMLEVGTEGIERL